MLKVKQLHRWDVSYHEAVAIQNELRQRVQFRSGRRLIRRVAGADVAYDKRSNELYAVLIVLGFPELEVIEQTVVQGIAAFPYIPGLLSFREAPIVAEAFRKLSIRPDVLICDGQGVAHPRRFGLACHLGLLFDIPTIGCAKSRLCGTHGEVGLDAGSSTPLRLNNRSVGAVLRTRAGVKPVYVSVGHLISLHKAVRLVLACCKGYRIPEPTRRAHHLVSAARKRHVLSS
ncbi:MAG: deoxyribonuclease V [Candidatus Abyssobacteria bacterium SURF_17]|jgi:deoxyribonuclease V|uniref:Endonuclease V n=1 Tax=Candidatus Abyssobacteria bacterium SURF_17 TaxID=2093361 RepID=A0A419F2Y7_9BACT|nr:MAG: deoxyribonuclease V [Candidatus Abyssubacteria bacterium SURF_17]